LPAWRCAAAVRMSFGPMADEAFIAAACERIAHCGRALRQTCLIPSAGAADTSDGIVQLSADGECTWLVFDAASRTCAVIDPLEPLVGRIADLVRCQGFQVRAVVDTHEHAACASGRSALLLLLDAQLDRVSSKHSLGWPAVSDCISLGNGMLVNAVSIGAQVLARVPRQEGMADSVTYLLGAPGQDGALAAADVRFAFTGEAVAPAMADVVGDSTILCGSLDTGSVACTTFEARESGSDAAALGHQLDEAALEKFMESHPGALLIDVREPFEHVAAGAGSWHGRQAQSVPLSRLADRLGTWLRSEQRPLVFFCRSGGRSAKAAQCLHRLGYRNAWHVAGSLSFNSRCD